MACREALGVVRHLGAQPVAQMQPLKLHMESILQLRPTSILLPWHDDRQVLSK